MANPAIYPCRRWLCLLLLFFGGMMPQVVGAQPTLGERIRQGFHYQLRMVGFGMATRLADTPRNPDNIIWDLPQYTAALQVRPDFSLDLDRLSVLFQPRGEWYHEWWTRGAPSGEDKGRSELFIRQWLARWRATDLLYLSFGRETLQWGPSYLASLSNPFFEDNGKSNPKLEVAAKDFARVVWVPSLSWTVSLIANTGPGRAENSRDDFSEKFALKTDYTGSADYGSIILAGSEGELDEVSGFFRRTATDAWLVYAEGVLQRNPKARYPQPSDDPLAYVMMPKDRPHDTWVGSILAGASCTLESGATFTLEYLHYGPGFDQDEADAFFDLQDRAARAVLSNTVLTTLGYQALGASADPGLRFLRRNYAMLQYVQIDIADVLNLTLRWTRNLDDDSNRFNFIGEWFLGDHVQLFGVGIWSNGDGRSEFGSAIGSQVMIGMTYFFS